MATASDGAAALLVPGSLALIGAAYPEKARGAAIGTWSASTSIASAVGPVLGGWVVAHASWRWLFFFNLPVGAVAATVATRRVPESRDDEDTGAIDFAGAILAVVGLGAIVWAMLDAPNAGGLGAPRTIVLFALGGCLFFVPFNLIQVQHYSPTAAGASLLPLRLPGSTTRSRARQAFWRLRRRGS